MRDAFFITQKPKKDPPFTDDMKKELKDMYKFHSLQELADYFNRTIVQVKNQAQRQHLTKRW